MTNCFLSYDSSHFWCSEYSEQLSWCIVNANTELSEGLILVVTVICLECHNFISLELRIRSSLGNSRAMCASVICSNSLLLHLVETATSSVHANHSEFYNCVHAYKYCHATKQILPVSYAQYTYVVPISTSGMLAHTLTDCSRLTGEGQGEEEEDTEEG